MIDRIFKKHIEDKKILDGLLFYAIMKSEHNLKKIDQSNVGGRQSQLSNNDPEYLQFYNVLKITFDTTHSNNNNDIQLKSAYFNVNSKYSYHHLNSYEGGFYSGILWLKHGPKRGVLKFLEESKKNIILNKKNKFIEINPEVGDIIFFPSELSHLIEINLDDIPQIFMKFNFIMKNE